MQNFYRTKISIALLLCSLGQACAPNRIVQNRARGLKLEESIFSQIQVFARLDTATAHVAPSSSLRQYCPRPRNQGEQESCVAWSSAYAAHTIWLAKTTHQNPNTLAFSPSFVYNQVQKGACGPCFFADGLKVLQTSILPLGKFPYNENTCANKPTAANVTEGEKYRITGFQRLTRSDTDLAVDTIAIKQHLAQGVPVLIGALITDSFCELTEDTWTPATFGDETVGGHAMCIVGYDDRKEGGAFQLMNSWGTDWAAGGFAWVRYADFMRIGKEAYALFATAPVDSTGARLKPTKPLNLTVALRDTANNTIPLQKLENNYTYAPKQEPQGAFQFRIEVKNEKPCFLYVLRRTTANKYEILYPYNKMYSAYCGITGTRLFPQKGVLSINDRKNSEEIAVIAAQNELDYDALNAAVQQGKGGYAARIAAALKINSSEVQPTNEGDLLTLRGSNNDILTIAAILKVQKQPIVEAKTPVLTQKTTFDDRPRNDTIFISTQNKTVKNGYLEFDVAARGARLFSGANYLSSVQVEFSFDPQMYNTATATQPIEISAGKNFAQATKVGAAWKPSYNFEIKKLAPGRIRASMLMNEYPNSQHVRGSIANTPVLVYHIRIPLSGCKTKSSQLQLVKNPDITVGTYVEEYNTPFGDAKRFLNHVFAPINGTNDTE